MGFQTLTFNFKTRSGSLISMTTLPSTHSILQYLHKVFSYYFLCFCDLGMHNITRSLSMYRHRFAGEDSIRGSAVRDSNHKPALWQAGALTWTIICALPQLNLTKKYLHYTLNIATLPSTKRRYGSLNQSNRNRDRAETDRKSNMGTAPARE